MFIVRYFVSISVFISQLSIIHTVQGNEKTQYENSLLEFKTLMEVNKRVNESSLAQNLQERVIKKNMKSPIEKSELRHARNILIKLRDYIYNEENICIRYILRMKNSTVTPPSNFNDISAINTIFPTNSILKSFILVPPAIKQNEQKHSHRWKTYFEKCHDRDFLPIKAKINTPWDREIFSQQIDVLVSITRNYTSNHLPDRWYKDSDYSKDSFIRTLKEHTEFDDTFLIFIGVLYDMMFDFTERWRKIAV